MIDRPRHPETHDEPPPAGPPLQRARRSSGTTVVGISVGVALLVLMIVLHLTGVVGAGAH